METSTSNLLLVRHGKEWFEHCMARAIVYWTRQGGGIVGPHTPPGWSTKVGIWDWFRKMCGKYDYKPDYESVEVCFPVDRANYLLAVNWVVNSVPEKFALRINFNAVKDVFQRIPPEQQRRIVELLYERYPT